MSSVYRKKAGEILDSLNKSDDPESLLVGVLEGMDCIARGELYKWWEWRDSVKAMVTAAIEEDER